MAIIIRAFGFANGHPCPHAGQFLEWFDFDAYGGVGFGHFTADPAKAKRFDTTADAMAFWQTQSTVKPTRPDGLPNRPLTLLTATLEHAP